MLQVDIKKRLEADGTRGFTLDASFSAGEGISILFGPSGAGKTTVLRSIAGIITPDQGRISLDEHVYFEATAGVNLSIQERRVGYVFQDYALFPHMTAEQNVVYGIKAKTEGERREKARATLALFAIEHVAQHYPRNMSGGEQQRTALARALASDPAVVLLDEPLSAIDVRTRGRLLDEIMLAQQRVGIPFVYVTHNIGEAMRLGTSVVVLDEGRVAQTGSPTDILGFAQS